MRITLRLIALKRPRAFVLENVLGITDCMPDEEVSPLELIVEELVASGYAVQAYVVGLSDWVSVARDRTPMHHWLALVDIFTGPISKH